MVTSTGNIATTGDNAYGIGAVTGGAGAITVTSTGNVSTQGNLAFAIYANGAGGGAVTVTSTGNLATGVLTPTPFPSPTEVLAGLP